MSLRAYTDLCRPFTLVAPALGIASGAVIATGALGAHPLTTRTLVGVGLATAAAAILNAASNALNQVADLEIDRINRPERPLPSGLITPRAALTFAAVAYLVAVAASFAAGVWTGGIFIVGAVLSIAYSVGPRLKRHWLTAGLTIALARGLLLQVAGWATVRPPDVLEPWLIGLVVGLYTFGASHTKDVADVAGDRAMGIQTLVIQRGLRTAAWISAPCFMLPFLALPPLALTGLLTGSVVVLSALGLGLALWGAYAARLVVRDPDGLARKHHPSWRHMYLIMFATQVGIAAAYLVGSA